MDPLKFAVIGAGAFGKPMALHISEKHECSLYDNEISTIDFLRQDRSFDGINLESDLERAVKDTGIIVMAVPSQKFRTAVRNVREHLNKGITMLNLSKGLEVGTNKRMSEIAKEELYDKDYNYAVLSGGMIASQFAKKKLLFADIASTDFEKAKMLCSLLVSENLILFPKKDLVGVELAGPLKNVIAISAGYLRAKGYDSSTIGDFITAFSGEVKDLAVKLGANPETYSSDSQSWAGDLQATCYSGLQKDEDISRNVEFGILIGKGYKINEAIQIMTLNKKTVEGYPTAKALYHKCKEMNTSIPPIIHKTYDILYRGESVDSAIQFLRKLADRKIRNLYRTKTE